MKGTVVRVIAIIISVIGVILSFIIADAGYGFSWIAFFSSIVPLFLFIFPWFVLASILDWLEEIYIKLNTLSTSNLPPQNRYLTELSNASQPVRKPEPGDTWTCNMCGTVNLKSAMSCKDCGSYR